MKIRNSLKSLKDRHRDNRVIRRRGRTYVINKTNPRIKARQGLSRRARGGRRVGIRLGATGCARVRPACGPAGNVSGSPVRSSRKLPDTPTLHGPCARDGLVTCSFGPRSDRGFPFSRPFPSCRPTAATGFISQASISGVQLAAFRVLRHVMHSSPAKRAQQGGGAR